MQISKVEGINGGGKKVMSQFPMKGVRPNWFMMVSGCNTTADWKVITQPKFTSSKHSTPKINGHNFVWTNCIGGDISKTNMHRFSVSGTNDSYLCWAEEKADDAKKITYVLGGWGNA